MKEYIERAKVLESLGYEENRRGDVLPGSTFDIILKEPASDVVEVRHGIWIPSESDFDDDDTLFDVEDWCDWQCSVCREDICYEDPMERRFLPKFCPNCGARMDKEET